ncbi:metalloregulator ArsR/SmtB family transcription factor [Proteiniclasticum sp. QWL-01]|uniref:ArsR/SmtB family transcription factor n=1 Tax=Proteiniclasticum sp. QWL-01 TaxID=3036945 RepID=UPI00241109B0|nr:metalloregulator ArsR/SmtB family transcription factor [Proteiniclasticum sp. QWL-01]WFF73817.1 metalloregulator ArsR/SmtB family transcription factor [Proteiniclasticum sp. QWL-01]
MEQNAKDIAQILKIMGNENRVLILCQLMKSPLTVTELSERLSHISQSALSQHLAVLKAHGILDSEKKGLHITYSLKDDRILAVLDVIRSKFCE